MLSIVRVNLLKVQRFRSGVYLAPRVIKRGLERWKRNKPTQEVDLLKLVQCWLKQIQCSGINEFINALLVFGTHT